jgi:hypothetical protein
MTANPSKLQRLLVDDETSAALWAENVTSMSGAVALPVTGPVEVAINQPMFETSKVTQYRNQGTLGAPGVFDITLAYSLYLCGHGSTTAGAITVSDLETHLGWVLGGGPTRTANAGTAINGGTSTTTNLVVDASDSFAPGGLFRVGAKGDSGGDGQWNVVATNTGTDIVTRVALPAAPGDDAVVYSATNIHTVEDGTSSAIVGKRFLWLTANTQWLIHGAFPTAITLSGFNGGEMPMARVTCRGSWAEPRAETFPDTTAQATHVPAPVAAGSLNIQAHGTTTRNAVSYRNLTVDFTLGVAPLPGGDGVNAYQSIVGARRTVDRCVIRVTVDAPAASATPNYWTAWATNSWHHILWSGSTADGQAMAWYAARCKYIGARPTQTTNGDLNAVVLEFEAHTNDAVTTSALTLSALRIGFA